MRHSRRLSARNINLVVRSAALAFLVGGFVVVALPPSVAQASTQTVTNCSDSGAGSLRQAVADAAAGDTITFSLSPPCSTIVLSSSQIAISKNLTISGPGAGMLAVSGDTISRVFEIDGGSVTISGLTIEDGAAPAGSTGPDTGGSGGDGGGIYNVGKLTLIDDIVSNNIAGAGGNGGPGIGATGGNAGDGGNGGGIYNAGTLTLTGVTVTNNSAGAGGAGGANPYGTGGTGGDGGYGGGIYNNVGSLTLTDDTVSGNGAGAGGTGGVSFNGNTGGTGGSGGGIFSNGTVTLTHVTVSGNSSGAGGDGGSYSGGSSGFGGYGGPGGGLGLNSGSVSLTEVTVSGNSSGEGGDGGAGSGLFGAGGGSGGSGGGIWNGSSTLTLADDTVSGNNTGSGGNANLGGSFGNGTGGRGGYGGGIANSGTLTLTNDTVSGNSTGGGGTGVGGTVAGGYGGGISTSDDVGGGDPASISNSTLSGNSAASGSGIFLGGLSGVLSLGATIVADSPSGSDCVYSSGSLFTDNGYNLGDDNSCGLNAAHHDLADTNPLFDPAGLKDNGGPTQTIALTAGSPAVDYVALSSLCPSTDQRGYPRPDGSESACDIGAYEFQDSDTTAPTTTITLSPTSPNGSNGWYTGVVGVTISASDPDDAVPATRCVLDPTTAPTSFSDLPAGACSLTSVAADGMHMIYAASEDSHGNIESPIRSASVDIDQTDPTLAPTFSATPIFLGQAGVTASPNADDATSGVASSSCGAIVTSSAGDHTVTCSATDNAGNTASESVHYTVEYKIAGFFSPLPLSRAVAGRTVPVKIALTDVNGRRISDAQASALARSCRVVFSATGAQSLSSQCMKYGSGQFTYNWRIAAKPLGNEMITVTVSYPGTTGTTTKSESLTITTRP